MYHTECPGKEPTPSSPTPTTRVLASGSLTAFAIRSKSTWTVPTPLIVSSSVRVLAGQLKGHRQPLAQLAPFSHFLITNTIAIHSTLRSFINFNLHRVRLYQLEFLTTFPATSPANCQSTRTQLKCLLSMPLSSSSPWRRSLLTVLSPNSQ